MSTTLFTMEFKYDEQGKLVHTSCFDREYSVQGNTSVPEQFHQVSPRRKRSRTVAGGSTKQQRVAEILRENPTSSRKELIDIVVNQLGMTPAGASTYIANARKMI